MQCGSDPKNASDHGRKLVSIAVNPPNFVIDANTILLSEAYWQLAVTGTLANSCGTVDLTSTTQGTNYTSSDLTKCNFGAEAGRVFAGADGTCTITATNGGFSATANGTVTTFAPTADRYQHPRHYQQRRCQRQLCLCGRWRSRAAGGGCLQPQRACDRRRGRYVWQRQRCRGGRQHRLCGRWAKGLQIIDITDPHKPA
ncbi:MAG TPA: hypothetical protein VKK81_24660, partial [Candidatus Binatia bacterium]|nr:hypothetical protein [Candidatus Binatia bacterium]